MCDDPENNHPTLTLAIIIIGKKKNKNNNNNNNSKIFSNDTAAQRALAAVVSQAFCAPDEDRSFERHEKKGYQAEKSYALIVLVHDGDC